jgi:hypothetical protein
MGKQSSKVLALSAQAESTDGSSRLCSGCTACCEGWLEIDTQEIRASLGQACVHCVALGCSIYETRPEKPCREFHCAWAQNPLEIPQWMRPDHLGLILSLDRLSWNAAPVLVAVACSMHVSANSLLALKQFAHAKSYMLLVLEFESENNHPTGKKRLHIQGPEPFAQEMSERFNKGERLW